MPVDRFHGQHTTESPEAVAAFEEAVEAVAAHRPVGDTLSRALEADPNMIAAHVLSTFGAILLGRAETISLAAETHKKLKGAVQNQRHLTAGEQALVESLDCAVAGYWRRAAKRLELHLETAPEDFLAAKIAHALRFLLGDREAMVRLTGNLVTRAPESGAGYGFLLGCHAFCLEETGSYAEAEACGRKAVAKEPADSWGLHAVSHVFEMTGRAEEGREWLSASRPTWSRCNNFSFHMAWHLALYHLETGDHETVLTLYDEEIRPQQTDDFRDMSNAVSMLWRLEQEGVNVGDRWQPLYEIAYRRRKDTTYIFGSLHYLLALIASGDLRGAEELIDALRERKGEDSDQARVARYIGWRVAQALLRMPGHCAKSGLCLAEMAKRLPVIGGSHAQRDVFIRSLMAVAMRSQDYPSLRAITSLRHELRQEDRFDRTIAARMQSGTATGLLKMQHQSDHFALIRLI